MPISNACSKSSNGFSLSHFVVMVALSIAPLYAHAQEGAVDEPPQPAAPTMEAPAQPGGGLSLSDPCPTPATDMAKTPDDLAKVQADIDRYTLCMERAQLLQRLNDLALENQEKLNEASGISSDNPGMKLDKMPSFAEQKEEIMRSIRGASVDEQVVAEPALDPEWRIIKILGAGSGLSAQLGKGDGTLARAKPGDTLPDGSSVNSVSATSVEITQDGKTKTLRWLSSDELSQMSGG